METRGTEFVVHDERFASFVLGNARLERLWTGGRWLEGPVYVADAGHLLFSDIPNDRVLRWLPDGHVSIWREPSNYANGATRDREGRVLHCEHGARRVTRTELDGHVTVLADRYRGFRLNSPNDVVVRSDGTVWFTDPPYGILSDYEGHRADPELPGCYVFRLDPSDGELTVAADDVVYPNGIAFSPNERTLYVADSAASHLEGGPRHLRAYDVSDDGVLSGSRVLATVEPGVPDGFRLDDEGFIWCSAGDGIRCLAPDGTLLGQILVPETVSNCTFGGIKRNRLFITASTSLYAIYLNRTGADPHWRP